MLLVEFFCPHKQNGYCLTSCLTIEDVASRKSMILIYVKIKTVGEGYKIIDDHAAVDKVRELEKEGKDTSDLHSLGDI